MSFVLAEQRTRPLVPMTRRVFADMETPLSVYCKLADQPYSYLFESVEGGEVWGRYSIIGLPCRRRVEVYDGRVRCFEGDTLCHEICVDDPLAWLETLHTAYQVATPVAGLPRPAGGLVGCFGFDTVRYIEPCLRSGRKDDELGLPDILLLLSMEVVVFDGLTGHHHLLAYIDPELNEDAAVGEARLDAMETALAQPFQPRPLQSRDVQVTEEDFISGLSQQGFEDAVRKAKRYIVEGDIMQVVLSQRLSIPFRSSPLDLYRVLRLINPSPYLYFLDLQGTAVVGSSPEILVRAEEGKATVRPIAGTRRRGHDAEEDLRLEQELLCDPKELAEHVMLIDLGRNDLGRVAQTGSVQLTEKMQIERYSHVMHIVSQVCADLQDDVRAMDVLRATFPAGTVSGAPKIRALQIIDELEPVGRGFYAGAVGYWSWHGAMDTAIAIRTAIIQDGMLHIQAGAGIVADSVPELEWEETMNKGRAIFKAVSLAETGRWGKEN